MTEFPSPSSGRGLWSNFTRHPIWAAVIAGLIVAGILGVIHHFSTPSGPSGISGSTPSGGSSSVAAGSPHTGSSSSAQPIQLSNLPHPNQEPQVISVTGTGDLSQGKHLWVFVYGSGVGRYFPQGKVDSPNPNPWTVLGVHVGESGTQDSGHPFTIYVVVVDDSTSAEIDSFAGANPNRGYSEDDWRATLAQFVVDSAQVKRA